MFTKIRFAVTIIGVVSLLIAMPALGLDEKAELSAAQPAEHEGDGGHWCNPAGTWISINPDSGQVWFTTLVPVGEGRNRYVMVGESQFDPSYGGWLPAVAITTYRGELVRIGHNTYATTHAAYAIDADFNPVYTAVSYGTVELIDCDHSVNEFHWSVYGPDQDPFGDEPPLYGCMPLGTGSAQRMPEGRLCE